MMSSDVRSVSDLKRLMNLSRNDLIEQCHDKRLIDFINVFAVMLMRLVSRFVRTNLPWVSVTMLLAVRSWTREPYEFCTCAELGHQSPRLARSKYLT